MPPNTSDFSVLKITSRAHIHLYIYSNTQDNTNLICMLLNYLSMPLNAYEMQRTFKPKEIPSNYHHLLYDI